MSEWCGDAETPSVFQERTRVARKTHYCDACCEVIPPGSSYCNIFGVWDGNADTIKRCARCDAIYEHLLTLTDEDDCQPALRLDCGHDYASKWGEEPPPEIAALAFWIPGDPLP